MNAASAMELDPQRASLGRGSTGPAGERCQNVSVRLLPRTSGRPKHLQLIDSQPIEDFVRDLLRNGRVAEARAIAYRSAKLPESLRRALKRPVARVAPGVPSPKIDIRTAIDLASGHEGEWVAVQNGKVVGHEMTAARLRSKLQPSSIASDTLILKIPKNG